MPLLLRGDLSSDFVEAYSTNLNPFGIQFESDAPLENAGFVVIRPRGDGEFPEGASARGQIRWIKSTGDHFRYGVSFDDAVDWHLPLSRLVQGLCVGLGSTPYFQSLVDSLDDGIVFLDGKLRVLATNAAQPFFAVSNPEEIIGRDFSEVKDLTINTPEGNISLSLLINTALEEKREITLSSCPLVPAGSSHGVARFYDIWVTPLEQISALVLRTRDVTEVEELKRIKTEKEKNFWLHYKYLTLGRLFDDLLEDIVNPLSAVVGRLDLLNLKLSNSKTPVYSDQIKLWLSDLDLAQKALDNIKEFCRSASRRRYRDTRGVRKFFSLNALVEEELRTLELHSAFKKIRKRIELSSAIPPVQGEYSDWANAFVSLCQRIVLQQGGRVGQREITIITELGNGHVELRFIHNGKALPIPFDSEFSLAALELLKKKYGVSVCMAGESGHQTITLKIPVQEKKE